MSEKWTRQPETELAAGMRWFALLAVLTIVAVFIQRNVSNTREELKTEIRQQCALTDASKGN